MKPIEFRGEPFPSHHHLPDSPIILDFSGLWQIYCNPAGAMGKVGNGDDMLSMLPDDILVNILDRLNVPDAARTSFRPCSLVSQ